MIVDKRSLIHRATEIRVAFVDPEVLRVLRNPWHLALIAAIAYVACTATVASALTRSETQVALANAVAAGDPALVREMLSAGANPNGERNDGARILDVAVRSNGPNAADVLRILVHAGGRLTNADVYDAVAAGPIPGPILNVIANELHLSLDATNPSGQTFLFGRLLNEEQLDYLTSHGLDVNHRDVNGQTALTKVMSQYCFDNTSFLTLLMQYGASPNVRDKAGKSANDYALLHACTVALSIFKTARNGSPSAAQAQSYDGQPATPATKRAEAQGSSDTPLKIEIKNAWNDMVNGVMYVHDAIVISGSQRDVTVGATEFTLTMTLANGGRKSYPALTRPAPSYSKYNVMANSGQGGNVIVPEVDPRQDLGAIGPLVVPAGGVVTATVTFAVPDAVANASDDRAVALR